MAAALGLTPTIFAPSTNCESISLDTQLKLLDSFFSVQSWQSQCRKTAQRRNHRQSQGSCRRSRCSLDQGSNGASKASSDVLLAPDSLESPPFTVAMKFGGSSLATADRMQEVARVIASFPNESPIIVLSAMGRTTNLLLQAGDVAVSCEAGKCKEIAALQTIKENHERTVEQLGLDIAIIQGLLEELGQLLTGIALMKELTERTKDYLVSFGERMSTRVFAALLAKKGIPARQYDSFDIGFITTDEFTNSDILDATYPAVRSRLTADYRAHPAVPIVTGFLGKGVKSGAITTLGRGGSDLTATVLGRALQLREVQVWKDVDGVLTCDPHIVPHALTVPFLTFDEAAELAYFGAQVLHPQSMRPAREGNIPVRVLNSYNPSAPGTLISHQRDMRGVLLTSIVCKSAVTLLDIVSLRMLGQFGFLAKVFAIFEQLGISVDVVATSEVSLSLTLDAAKMWSRELVEAELERMVEELRTIATVRLEHRRSIISLIGNVHQSSLILEKAFRVCRECGVNVQMISQGASKVNISMVVDDAEALNLVRQLHREFFEKPLANEGASDPLGDVALHAPSSSAELR